MSEPERPKPQYGEYASDADYASALERSGVDPTKVEPTGPTLNGHSVHSAPLVGAHSGSPQTPRQRSAFDRIATLFFLSFGLISIIGGASNYLNLGATLHTSVKQMGMGDYIATEQTAGFGIAMLVSQIILWILAAGWSFRRLSRNKLSWWVPVVAGALSFLVLTVLLGVLLAADPSFIATLPKP